MRVRFRILLYKGGKRLRKAELKDRREPLWVGVRYITEFKYLEATKWLLVAPDSYEKYLLLGLINLALGQEEQAEEFLSTAGELEKSEDLDIVIEYPQEGKLVHVRSPEDVYRNA